MGALPKLDELPSVTVERFLDTPRHPYGWREQLVDGVVVTMDPASVTHGLIMSTLSSLLVEHLRARGTGCVAVTAPGVVPHAQSRTNVRIPDLAVTCSEADRRDRLLRHPAVLFEVLSPSNEAQTRNNIWAYQSIPTAREIVLLRSSAIAAELLARSENGAWPAGPRFLGEDDRLRLDSIGADFALRDVYATVVFGED